MEANGACSAVRRSFLPVFSVLLSAACLCGGGEISRPPDSLFQVEELPFKIVAAHPGWRGTSTQSAETLTFPGESPELRDGFEIRRGTFQIGSYGSLALEEGKKEAGNEMEVRLKFEAGKTVGFQLLFVTVSLPFPVEEDLRFRINGRWNRFAEYYNPSRPWQINIPKRSGNRIEIPLRRGFLTLAGNFQAMFQDNRILLEQLKAVLNDGNHRTEKGNDSYYMLKKTTIPTVIVECGFLSNPNEKEMLLSEEYQEKIAWALHLGILEYLNTIQQPAM